MVVVWMKVGTEDYTATNPKCHEEIIDLFGGRQWQ